MKLCIKYIASIILSICALATMAQDSLQVNVKDSLQLNIVDTVNIESIDSVEIATADTTNNLNENYFHIYISVDYGKLITTAAQFDTRHELNLGVQFAKNLRATADFGYAKLAPPDAIENGTYSSSGNYYRIGLDYMLNIAPKTYLSFGGMYALSNFKDEGTVETVSEVWPSLNQSFTRNGFTSTWAELVVTSEAPVLNRDLGFFSNLYWGVKFRLRFLIDRPEPENFDVYAIPGYGRTFNNTVPAANLFIMYKF